MRKLFGGLFLVAVVLGGVFVATNHRNLLDQFKFNQFTPSSQIARLATRADMSDKGRFYFYVAHPEVEDSGQFNKDCRRIEGGSAILGCYVPITDKIHIYNVQNPELDGVKEVTAAHEMLHVVYSRLSQEEKNKLAPLLEAAYKRVETPKLIERMQYYERTQPDSRENELHSILGTEFSNLGPELEAHYAKYFSDRSRVVALHNNYNQRFIDIENRLDALEKNINAMKPEIESMTRQYEANLASFNAKADAFNARATSGFYSSAEQFNADRNALVAESNSLEQSRLAIISRVDEYNRNVGELNELGRQAERLNNSLDSTKAVQ